MNYANLRGYFLWHWVTTEAMQNVRIRMPTVLGNLWEPPKIVSCFFGPISFQIMGWAEDYPELNLFPGCTINGARQGET